MNEEKIKEIAKYYYGEFPIIQQLKSENNAVFNLKFRDFEKIIKIDIKGEEEPWLIEKEMYLFDLLKKNNIPVPKVEHFDITGKFIPEHWFILEKLGDKDLNKLFLESKNVKKQFIELGKYLAKSHSIKFEEQGIIFHDGIEKITLKNKILKKKEMLSKLVSMKKITPNQEIKILNAIKNFQDSNEAVLCHNDFGPWQAIVNEGHINGIIDWEWAESSDSVYDFSKTELLIETFSGNLKEFKEGYESIKKLPKNYENIKINYQIIEIINYLNFFVDNEINFKKGINKLNKLLNITGSLR